MNNDEIELTGADHDLLSKIANSEGITVREALHEALFLFAMQVDYTINIKQIFDC